ncbi:MAG: hypothetical protein ACPKM0_06055 [Pleomorphochaeta sp.]
MNKKIYSFTLIFIFSLYPIFSTDTTYISYDNYINPTNTKIGEIDFGRQESISNLIKNILSDEYSNIWIDNYIKEEYKYMFSKKYSKTFVDLLPITKNFYCSKVKNYENNRSVSVYISDNMIINFIFDKNEDEIINVNFD